MAKRGDSVNGKGPSTEKKADLRPSNGRLVHEHPVAPAEGEPIGAPNRGPLPKTHLSDEEMGRFRDSLLAKRRELLGDVNHMEDEALRHTRSDASGDLSMMPIHMADIGTDNYEQEFTIGLIANERDTLKEIDAALKRIEDGTYGVCLATHKPISKARLSVKPWASYCVEYERAHEGNGRRPH